VVGGGDPFQDLLDAARADEAARSRVRERWLRQQAEEGARLSGTLLDLAELGVHVAVRTASGRSWQGTVVAVGRDFCVLRGPWGPDTCLSLGAVTLVRPGARAAAPTAAGDRVAPLDLTLRELLARLAGGRPEVGVVSAGEGVSGRLQGVGVDVLSLQLDSPTRQMCYVSLGSVSEVVLRASG
jgi:hypothetical protein